MSRSTDITEEEDASELELGEEFNKEECLSNAEVFLMLDAIKKVNEEQDKAATSVFEETYQYVKRFSEGNVATTESAVKTLRETLENKQFEKLADQGEMEEHSLRKFEIASLLNMPVDEAEEAFALIPSLQKIIKREDLQDVLDLISKSKDRSAFA